MSLSLSNWHTIKAQTVHHSLVKSLGDTHTAAHATGRSIWTLQPNNFADAFFGLPSATSQAGLLFCHFSGNETMNQAARGLKTSLVGNSLIWLTALILYELQQGMQVFLQNKLVKQHNLTWACPFFLVKWNSKLRNIRMKDSFKYPNIWGSVVLLGPSLHILHFFSLDKQWSLCLRSHSNTCFIWSYWTSPTTPYTRERRMRIYLAHIFPCWWLLLQHIWQSTIILSPCFVVVVFLFFLIFVLFCFFVL